MVYWYKGSYLPHRLEGDWLKNPPLHLGNCDNWVSGCRNTDLGIPLPWQSHSPTDIPCIQNPLDMPRPAFLLEMWGSFDRALQGLVLSKNSWNPQQLVFSPVSRQAISPYRYELEDLRAAKKWDGLSPARYPKPRLVPTHKTPEEKRHLETFRLPDQNSRSISNFCL